MQDSKSEPRKLTVHLAGPGARFVTGTTMVTPLSRLDLWIISNVGGRGVEWTTR